MTKDIVIKLAEKLYFDLPFWKRWRIRRYYYKNNWDVTGEWEKCFQIAYKMILDLEASNKKQTTPATNDKEFWYEPWNKQIIERENS